MRSWIGFLSSLTGLDFVFGRRPSHEWLGYCQGCWRQGDSFITDVIAAMNGWAIVKDVGGFAQIRKLDCKMLGHNMLRNVV
jgi:hypothetical protein